MMFKARKFTERYRGIDAGDAFKVGSRVSRSTHGVGAGWLCDKSHFIPVDPGRTVISDDEIWSLSFPPEILDVWGPAGCVDLGGGNYLFFGISPVV